MSSLLPLGAYEELQRIIRWSFGLRFTESDVDRYVLSDATVLRRIREWGAHDANVRADVLTQVSAELGRKRFSENEREHYIERGAALGLKVDDWRMDELETEGLKVVPDAQRLAVLLPMMSGFTRDFEIETEALLSILAALNRAFAAGVDEAA
ncbi:hypothetical protein HFN60_30265 [Rhizobium leguminosarum]|uniref:hypothetical protein n=1 Tax=Rhizobium leguminosarum TaxID=384 RepID=UPI001C965A83|nr:hypothetical protein [Rhizobium leguminosarum]MBY5819879.1 hypothetical protein [Rhizobium leguminosarum]